MTWKTRQIVLRGVAVAAVAATLAGAAYAAGQSVPASQGPGGSEGPGGRGPGGPGGFMGRGGRGGPMGPGMRGPLGGLMLGRLDLSDAQEARVKEIVDSHRKAQRALGEKAFSAYNALEAAISADPFDEGTVRTRAAEVAAIEADMAVARARIYSEVFQILTPEQQAEAKKRQAEMRQRQEQRRAQRGRAGQAQ